jgi:hypothetical protein
MSSAFDQYNYVPIGATMSSATETPKSTLRKVKHNSKDHEDKQDKSKAKNRKNKGNYNNYESDNDDIESGRYGRNHRDPHHNKPNNPNKRRPTNGAVACKVVTVVVLVVCILVLLAVLIYFLWAMFATISLETDCSKYNKYGGALPTKCPDDREYFLSRCFKKCPDSFHHSADCTCVKGTTETKKEYCEKITIPKTCKDPDRDYYGSSCRLKCDSDYTRVGACSCQKGETITDSKLYGNISIPMLCPPDREWYLSSCVKKCDPGYLRTSACGCTKGSIITDVIRFGPKDLPRTCPNGRDWYGSACYKGCHAGYSRTAACTCQKGSFRTSCPDYGFKTALQCSGGKTKIGALCYEGCPDGGERVDACSCKFGDTIITDCIRYPSRSITPPNSCPDEYEKFASACYGKCPSDTGRVSFCTCGNLDIITNCGLFGDAAALLQVNGPTCGPDTEYYGGLCYGKCPEDMNRTAAWTCSNYDGKIDCFKYGDAKLIGDDEGPKCDLTKQDKYLLSCFEGKCPEGKPRTALVTCSDWDSITDCHRFGQPKYIGEEGGPVCNDDEDIKDGLCYKGKCPAHQRRSAGCTCTDEETITDCDLYGDGRGLLDPFQLGPRCQDNQDYHAGLCYEDKCPEGWLRSAVCTCQKNNLLEDLIFMMIG